jgi:hypothetical protein
MCPITNKRHHQTIIRSTGKTRRELWGADSADGTWRFERIETAGTPWDIFHLPSVADETLPVAVDSMGNLPACREAVARGWLDKMLPERKAEHAAHMARLAAICKMADYDDTGRCRYCRQPETTHNPVEAR